jgi:hypothetical protein
MRTTIFVMIVMLSISAALGNVSVNHDYGAFKSDENVIVYVSIVPDSAVSAFDLAEMIPHGWKISNWDISGYGGEVKFEQQEQDYMGTKYNTNHWQFKDSVSGTVELKYVISNKPEGKYGFVSVWVWPGNFQSKNFDVNVDAKTTETSITGYSIAPQTSKTGFQGLFYQFFGDFRPFLQ